MATCTDYKDALHKIYFLYHTDCRLNAAIDDFKMAPAAATAEKMREMLRMAYNLSAVRKDFPERKRLYSLPREIHFFEIALAVERTLRRFEKAKAQFPREVLSLELRQRVVVSRQFMSEEMLLNYPSVVFLNWMIDEFPAISGQNDLLKTAQEINEYALIFQTSAFKSSLLRGAAERALHRVAKMQQRYSWVFDHHSS